MEQLQESVFPEEKVVYARFVSRFGAAFVDGFLVFMAWFIVGLSVKNAIVVSVNIAIAVLYRPLMEGSPMQATVGKKGLGIKVTNMEGGRITYGQAFGRHFAKIISGAILFLGYFMMLWNDKRQTLHDKIAGTLVVNA